MYKIGDVLRINELENGFRKSGTGIVIGYEFERSYTSPEYHIILYYSQTTGFELKLFSTYEIATSSDCVGHYDILGIPMLADALTEQFANLAMRLDNMEIDILQTQRAKDELEEQINDLKEV